MGNKESRGMGVLSEDINVVLSMAAPHYYENNIKPNEIFYRWPGAVHYTVCAWTRAGDGSNDMMSLKKGWEFLKVLQ